MSTGQKGKEMKILLLRASDDEWYKVVECANPTSLVNKYGTIILRKNWYTRAEDLKYWAKPKDFTSISECEYQATIYDDYIE